MANWIIVSMNKHTVNVMNGTSPRQIPVHIMSLANKYICNLVKSLHQPPSLHQIQ